MIEIESGSVLIALSTYPKEDSMDEFINQVENNYLNYKKGRAKNFLDIDCTRDNEQEEFNHNPQFEGGDSHIPVCQKRNKFHLYHNPVKYHIFGKYDIAFISLAENFSLSNKVFLPTRIDNGYKPGYIKSHVLSGIPLKCNGKSTEKKFENLLGYGPIDISKDSSFLCISNLKVNNSFLLGNGLTFLSLVKRGIENILGDDIISIIVMSFASSEISLVLFSDDIEVLKSKILNIRGMKIDCLKDLGEDLIRKILTNSTIPDKEDDLSIKYLNSHLFSDSQSFFGVKLDENNDWTVKAHPDFNTKIEWEIRPGHEKFVHKILSNTDNNINYEKNEINFIPGKTDFCFNFEESTKNLSLNYEINNLLRRPNSESESEIGKLIDHVRSIKTKIFFDAKETIKKIDENPGKKSSQEVIRDSIVTPLREIHKLRLMLKKLKISNELTNRIIKVVFNFDSAIQNPLVYNLFIDLLAFVQYLKEYIKLLSIDVDKYFNGDTNVAVDSVHSIEKKLSTLVKNFEDAYNLRYINNYSFDEVSDFLIDYNSPIQQIITSFDNYFKSLYSSLVGREIANRNITLVNELQTKATQFSVNFAIYNLYEPGVLFYCATKEIYTAYFKTEKLKQLYYDRTIRSYKLYCRDYFLNNPNSNCSHLSKLLITHNPNYHIIDYSRYKLFFDKDFKQFVFWHVSFLFQFPSIYNTNGDFNKEQFLKEFNRLLFLAVMADLDNVLDLGISWTKAVPGPNEEFLRDFCPNSKIKHIWNRTYLETRDYIVDLVRDKSKYFAYYELNSPISDKIVTEEDGEGYRSMSLGELTKQIHNGSLSYNLNVDKSNKSEDKYIDVWLQPDSKNEIDFNYIFNFSDGVINVHDLEKSFQNMDSKESLRSLTKQYLEEIYKRAEIDGSFIIPTLNRDWHTGDIEEVSFYNQKSDFLFDPNGGAFFHSFKRAKQYSMVRNKLYMILIHHSNLYKKAILKEWS